MIFHINFEYAILGHVQMDQGSSGMQKRRSSDIFYQLSWFIKKRHFV